MENTEFENTHTEITKLNTFSPWLSIWVKPRWTIRQLIDLNYKKYMLLISWIAGMISVLDQASNKNWGDHISLWTIIGIAIAGGAVSGILGLYLSSYVTKVVGSWLGGRANFSEMQIAIVRGGYVPSIIIGLLWIPELLLFRDEMFTQMTPRMDESSTLTILFVIIIVIQYALAIWAMIIGLKSIGEAHRFSAWRALWTVVIPIVAFVIVLSIIIGIVYLPIMN
ncbi:YIP1 family protein [Paenibacillus pini]|uniref:Yip1 domain-containing protein n=1 Tax=Paenibacillus pini JCM 16418 TaxID=1236976 RepID=W7YUJ8_9BACL|nr:YIP1 family protein [Paenibacillus pini]GAF06114.1 hypothetical protein JCM16418_59 [Paenibacillus pini JCM 16418]